MAGLLDLPDFNSAAGQGLLAASLSLMGAQKMPGQKGAFGSALANAGRTYMDTRNQAGEQLQAQEYKRLQLDALKRKIEQEDQMRKAAQGAFRSPEMANAMSQGPMPDGSNMPEIKPGFDTEKYTQSLYGIDPLKAMDFERSLVKENPLINVAQGGTLYDPKTGRAVFTSPKEDTLPSSVKEFNYGQQNPAFTDWLTSQKRAGATNVSNKTEVKMGEGVAAQVGPMVKDSKIQAGGAVKMFDAADRIEKAISSNQVSTGPFTTQVQTVKQLVQKIGGGNDDGIRQTRQVIKSLAQMAVEARKQLQGQGQVTESESAAVAKADAGDINDLTIGELKDLATLTKRAAHYTAKSHQELLTGLGESETTSGLSKFYNVQGMDTLLKHQPSLPKIGGSTNVDSLVDKYRSR